MKILPYVFLISLIFSCTNYFHSAQKEIKDDSLYLKFRLGKPLDSVNFYLHGDFKKFEKDKSFIWIKNSDFKKLLNHKFKNKPTSQILFSYSDFPVYSNLFGFYYDNLELDSLKKFYEEVTYYKLQNGISYFYDYADYKVSDTYLKKDSGVIRIFTINNPNSTEDRF